MQFRLDNLPLAGRRLTAEVPPKTTVAVAAFQLDHSVPPSHASDDMCY